MLKYKERRSRGVIICYTTEKRHAAALKRSVNDSGNARNVLLFTKNIDATRCHTASGNENRF
jgi:hypothetical protein